MRCVLSVCCVLCCLLLFGALRRGVAIFCVVFVLCDGVRWACIYDVYTCCELCCVLLLGAMWCGVASLCSVAV